MFVNKSKKGLSTLETIGAIILIIVFVLIITGGGSRLYAYFFDTIGTVSSCKGMGYIGGKCVPSNYACPDNLIFPGLGCEKNDENTHCCFEEGGGTGTGIGDGDETPKSKINVIKVLSFNSTQNSLDFSKSSSEISPDSEFYISCETNVKAPDCIEMSSPSPLITISSYREWGTSTDGKPILRMRARTSSTKSQFYIYCSVDKTKCDAGDSERQYTVITVK